MTQDQLIAALDEFDDSREALKKAQDRVRDAERGLKRACGIGFDTYVDGNELVAAVARKLRELLK